MSGGKRVMLLVALLAVGTFVIATPAFAAAGPIELVSKDAHEQADVASAPAISSDGRYVAFVATIGGLEGVFRKDLSTGELRPVAVDSAYDEVPYEGPGVAAPEAADPSISADGRYVSFTTPANLISADETGSSASDKDVYVADMSTEPPTYELASALNGSEEAITYEGGGGSTAAGRVALSGNGREVVFVTTGRSNLLGLPGGTPADQVVLRNLETHRTTLVSVERDPETGAMTGNPVAGGAFTERVGLGASLSADGSTVAWLGANLDEQVPMVAGEPTAPTYDEPLWRRVADGPGAPTRRIIGGGDPLAPGCPVRGTLSEPDCQGPFPTLPTSDQCVERSTEFGWLNWLGVQELPQLDADGRTVALVGQPNLISNLFLVNMGEGLDRRQALRQLTTGNALKEPCESQQVNNVNAAAGDGPIGDLSISADGDKIAFTTNRQQFPLSPPNLITAPPTRLGKADLYVLDLRTETIQRLTPANLAEASLPGFQAEQLEGAVSPSLSADGAEIAFASGAANLVRGDANEASDVFAVADPEAATAPGKVSLSAAPSPPRAKRTWKLGASARSLPDGRVRIRATLPGAGRLNGIAKALVGARLRRHSVATAHRQARGEGLLLLNLRLGSHYRRLARGRGGVAATVTLRFRAAGHRALSDRLQVSFRVHAKGDKGRRR
jgi:Tol biopolymer transport system component